MAKNLRSKTGGMGGTKPFAKQPAFDGTQEEYIRKALEENQGRSPEELQRELFEQVRMQKQNGQFDPAGLETFMHSVSPMLSPEQRAQMETLVRQIKNS